MKQTGVERNKKYKSWPFDLSTDHVGTRLFLYKILQATGNSFFFITSEPSIKEKPSDSHRTQNTSVLHPEFWIRQNLHTHPGKSTLKWHHVVHVEWLGFFFVKNVCVFFWQIFLLFSAFGPRCKTSQDVLALIHHRAAGKMRSADAVVQSCGSEKSHSRVLVSAWLQRDDQAPSHTLQIHHGHCCSAAP